jgi:hypothetical protein
LPDENPSTNPDDYSLTVRPTSDLLSPNGNVSREGNPWGRYLTALARGHGKEYAVEHSGITGTELTVMRHAPGQAEIEHAVMVAGHAVGTDDLRKLLAKAHGVPEEIRRHGMAMGTVDDRPVDDQVALRAMKLGAERSGDVGAAGKAAGTMTLNAAQIIVLLGNEP